MTYSIYIIISFNNKVYVGKTTGSLEDRIEEHKKDPTKSVLFGPNSVWRVIDKAFSEIEANEKEKIEIEKARRKYGYNNCLNKT